MIVITIIIKFFSTIYAILQLLHSYLVVNVEFANAMLRYIFYSFFSNFNHLLNLCYNFWLLHLTWVSLRYQPAESRLWRVRTGERTQRQSHCHRQCWRAGYQDHTGTDAVRPVHHSRHATNARYAVRYAVTIDVWIELIELIAIDALSLSLSRNRERVEYCLLLPKQHHHTGRIGSSGMFTHRDLHRRRVLQRGRHANHDPVHEFRSQRHRPEKRLQPRTRRSGFQSLQFN